MSHKIAFREYGHGPLLVLLHGFGGSVMHWDGVVEKLKNNYRVVVPNLSHLYMSKNRLLFPVIVELIAEFIKKQYPGEKVSIAGASFGGTIAWGVALHHPQLVERLVLLNPLVPHPVQNFKLPETRYFFVLPMDEKAIVRLLPTPIGQSFLKRCAQIFRPDREKTERGLTKLTGTKLTFVAKIISHFSWTLRNEDWNFWEIGLKQMNTPVLLVCAKDDQLFGLDAYVAFSHVLKAVRVETLESGGHILSKSRPDEIAKLCDGFLAKPKLGKPAA